MDCVAREREINVRILKRGIRLLYSPLVIGGPTVPSYLTTMCGTRWTILARFPELNKTTVTQF